MAIASLVDVEKVLLWYLVGQFPNHKFAIGPMVYDPQSFMPFKPIHIDGKRAFNLPQIYTTKVSDEFMTELLEMCRDEVEKHLNPKYLELRIGS